MMIDNSDTVFQKKCISRVQDLFSSHCLDKIAFTKIIGRKETFYKADFDRDSEKFEVYIYLDEAGVMRNQKKWYICEVADYKTEDDLIDDFIKKIESFL
jgi:hypothetical protein